MTSVSLFFMSGFVTQVKCLFCPEKQSTRYRGLRKIFSLGRQRTYKEIKSASPQSTTNIISRNKKDDERFNQNNQHFLRDI